MIAVAEADRYAQLIESMLSGLPVAGDPIKTGRGTSIERGLIFPLSAIHRATQAQVATFIRRFAVFESHPAHVIDSAGLSRPVYLPLLVYAWARAMAICPELVHAQGSELAAFEWAGILTGDNALLKFNSPEDVWRALALQALAPHMPNSSLTMLPHRVFQELSRAQQPNGSFLAPDAKAHPEIMWYHELQLLHAAGSYFALTGDAEVRESVGRCADYCLAEIQPDHATAQPWAVYPLLLQAHTRSLADQILHGHRIAGPAGPDAVSAILLADALVGLRAHSP